ncbi:centrosomal protein 15 [Tiliqua scincoides]|uniref:centrosomal protein 15 n=1 Tax=Tiliqua scincoides TaxID=71010 RepID=UPI0034621BC6
MASHLAQEVQLAKRHEEIVSQRLVLLQQMENHLRDKEAEKTWQTQEADTAHKRNTVLLNDIETARKKLHSREHLLLHPDTVNLETLYWAKIDESIPKWEAFFLGRTQTPIGIKTIKPAKQGRSSIKGSIPR